MSFPFFPMPFGTFLCVEGTFGLSKPRHGTVGYSVSSLGPVGSWQSAHRVQQTASDSSGSMPSSKENQDIPLSGQGNLGHTSSSLGPFIIPLSVQVSSCLLVSSQEGGGPCLSSQGTLEDSTCIHGNLGISSSSTGDLGTSPI